MDNEGALFLFVYLVLYMPYTVSTYWIVDFFFSIILHIGDYVISRNELYDVELCVPGRVVLRATRPGTHNSTSYRLPPEAMSLKKPCEGGYSYV